MIDWSWWFSHLAWFLFGGAVFFVIGFLLASVLAVSSGISAWEEAQHEPKPQDDSAQVAALKTELANALMDVEFYYRMATERSTV